MDDVHLIATCRAKPGHEAALRDVLRAAVAPSRAEPGVLSYVLNEDMKTPGKFVFIEHYADEAAMQAHAQSAHFKTLFAEAPRFMDGGFDLAMVRPVV